MIYTDFAAVLQYMVGGFDRCPALPADTRSAAYYRRKDTVATLDGLTVDDGISTTTSKTTANARRRVLPARIPARIPVRIPGSGSDREEDAVDGDSLKGGGKGGGVGAEQGEQGGGSEEVHVHFNAYFHRPLAGLVVATSITSGYLISYGYLSLQVRMCVCGWA